MNKEKLLKYCLFCEDAIYSNPFEKYPELIVLKHKSNNKWFGLIFELKNILYINLKIKPIDGAILRDEYSYITPAWHMNKTHWIKVDINKAEIDLLQEIIKASFELTKPKQLKKVKSTL